METIIKSMQAMLQWPAPLKLRPLAPLGDARPLAAMIVEVLAEFQFEWLSTSEQRAQCEERQAKSIDHDARLCAAEPKGTAFWVLVDTARDNARVGCVGVRRAAAAGNGTGWGDRAWEKADCVETAELHALYLSKRYRGKGLGRRLFE
eukprot:SAG11_NODE_11201_length_777_cov_0.786136_1_plen_147_part_10